MKRSGKIISVVAICIVSVMAAAQDTQAPSSTPTPAAQAPHGANTVPSTQSSSDTYVPDTTPLAGALNVGVGETGRARNTMNTSFVVTEQADSNAVAAGNQSSYQSLTTFSGNLDLQRAWKRNWLVLKYSGGGAIYSKNTELNSAFQQFGISQTLATGRWTFVFADSLNYTPLSPYGSGFGGLDLGTLSLNGLLNLRPGQTPDQTIFTSHSQRIDNTALGQVDYAFTRRTSFTASGSYGLLHFFDAPLLNSKQYNGTGGFNHELSARDTVALTYMFSKVEYDNVVEELQTHTMELRYARRVTGRLSFELGGGPQINFFKDGVSEIRRTFGSGHADVRYQTRRNAYSLHYDHSLTAGSGVITGARSDLVGGTISRRFTREWSGAAQGGYSRNSGLVTNVTYNSEYAGASLHRNLGRFAGLGFRYDLQHQTQVCVGTCGTDYVRHVFGVSFDWRMRPVQFE